MEESQTAVTCATSEVVVVDEQLVTAEQIISAHKDAVDFTWKLMDSGTKFIEKAGKCGKLLIAKKVELGHGNFLPWLAENIKEFGYDTANDYMKAARYLERAPNMGATSLRQILDLKQAAGILQDKPEASEKEEREKPAFVIRCSFNIEPEKLDEHQRKDAFQQLLPALQAFEAFGFIEIKA